MVMRWRAAPWHYEARHSVTRLGYTPHLEHSPALTTHSQRSTQTQSTGSPEHAATHALGVAGTTPSHAAPFSAARRGRRKRIVRRGSRPAQLTAAAERACQINPSG